MTVRTRPTVADRADHGVRVGTNLAHYDGLCTMESDPVTILDPGPWEPSLHEPSCALPVRTGDR